MLAEDGRYDAVVKDVVLFLRPGKVVDGVQQADPLTAEFLLELAGGVMLKRREYLEGNTGVLSDAIVQRLRNCFPLWDGTLEALEEGSAVRGVGVSIQVVNEADSKEPDKYWSRVEYMDPPGGRARAAMPDRIDSRTLSAKYGARFRALAGAAGKVVRPAAAGAPAPKAAAPVKSGPPAAPARPPAAAGRIIPAYDGEMSAEGVWAYFRAVCTEATDDRAADEWFKLLKSAADSDDQDQFTEAEWRMVVAAIPKWKVLPF